jgi:hypothetical protein
MTVEQSLIIFLKSLTFAKTGLFLEMVQTKKITKRNFTCYHSNPTFGVGYIRLNLTQVDQIAGNLIVTRGFSKEYLLLEVLLHEICHVLLERKYIKKHGALGLITIKFKDEKRRLYEEDVCDRYAHYCSKILMRDIEQWMIIQENILKGN